AGLAPASSYKYQVIAVRGGKHSARSRALDMDTVTPPVSDAVLRETFTVNFSLGSTTHFNWSHAKNWSDTWMFTPACQAGPCDVTLTGKFDGVAFTSRLARTGAVYAGTAPLRHWSYCSVSKSYTASTLNIRIQVSNADVVGLTWAASSWRGTATVDVAAGR